LDQSVFIAASLGGCSVSTLVSPRLDDERE
jgi:hypothetical protein